MNWITPAIVACLSTAIFFWARHMANRPRELGKVRYVPYTGIMFLALFAIILCLSFVLTRLS